MNKSNEYHTLIAKSTCVQEILEIIDRAARTESSVLITGESGVGKELIAEQVHLRSLRKDKPFIRVNCAAIPEGLLESELFGHVKGAFTDASSNRTGRFEAANEGSLFLDEVGDLPLALQAKILRVLQQKKFEKVGSNETINVNVRIIAATNKDLEQEVQDGRFRKDLYYRLNVLPVFIPPLRQRQEDILELAGFFLENSNKKTGKSFKGFSEDAVRVLLSYSWPGNVRELENCIERACVMGAGNDYIEPAALLIKRTEDRYREPKNSRNLKAAVIAFKANFVTQVLKDCNWNQTEAARVLAIQRTYLSKLIKELKITGDVNDKREK